MPLGVSSLTLINVDSCLPTLLFVNKIFMILLYMILLGYDKKYSMTWITYKLNNRQIIKYYWCFIVILVQCIIVLFTLLSNFSLVHNAYQKKLSQCQCKLCVIFHITFSIQKSLFLWLPFYNEDNCNCVVLFCVKLVKSAIWEVMKTGRLIKIYQNLAHNEIPLSVWNTA